MYRAILFAIFFITCCVNDIFSQIPDYTTSLSITQGLSNNSVRCIFQDKKGFMWFGTFDGLNRYDGYNFKIFRNRFNDSTSLLHNYIYAIAEDAKQQIWIGSGQGLNILDPELDAFSSAYYRNSYNKKISRFNYSVTCIKADRSGNLFIGTNNAGVYFKPRNTDLCIQLPLALKSTGQNMLICQGIAFGKDNTTWAFMEGVGLCKYDYQKRELILVDNSIHHANCISAADDGFVWLGTNKGLLKYSITEKRIIQNYSARRQGLTSDNITSLLISNDHKIYIGTDGGGLNIFDLSANKISSFGQQTNGIITHKVILDAYQDRDKRIWVATMRNGIDIIDASKANFHTVTQLYGQQNTLANNFVSAFCEVSKATLWIGTEDGGISVWNRQTGQFCNFSHSAANSGSLSSNYVTSILKDHTGQVWVASFSGGVDRYNASANNFEHLQCKNISTGTVNKDVWLLFEDGKKRLWAGTYGEGRLYIFDRKLNKFNVFDQNISDPYSFYEDSKGQLWCGTAESLIKIDTTQKRSHIFYRLDKPVRAIFEDKAGRFWIGTEGGGLCLFNRTTGAVQQRFTEGQGLPNNAVLNILEDDKGKIWLSTFHGLACFDYKRLHFNNFYQSDGLQSNQFSFSAALKLSTGELAFGGIKGFNIFSPDSIHTRHIAPEIVFTDIDINSKDIKRTNLITDNKNDVTGIRVPYKDAVLSFSFAGLDYSSPEHIRYAYYLDGWDKDWVVAGEQRTINYNNLPEGNYTLKVKSTNAAGEWSNNQRSLSVIILPPWFRTWWAYLIYIAVIASAAYVFINYRVSQQKLKYQIAMERMNSEREHEINIRKTSFFTYVSHEFRTPLMLIINPLQEVIERMDSKSYPELNVVYRNARRLLSLIDQLLLFNKTEARQTDMQISKIDLLDLCKTAFESFAYQAGNRKINYEFRCDPDEAIWIYGDKAKLEVILYNLLSNAFKFVRPEGSISFALENRTDNVLITIYDNGAGIAPDVGDNIFEKFYRASDQQSTQKAGFGIGLYLVRQFVELHKGRISYKSIKGEGTEFSINLFKGKEHFGSAPIDETSTEGTVFLSELAGEQAVITYKDKAGNTADKHNAVPEKGHECNGNVGQITYSKKTMLVIDDHPDVRNYIKQIFRDQFILLEAGNGEEGIKIAKEYIPDIILSDIMMDGKNGLELCYDIKQNPSLTHIPIILITASSSNELRLTGIKNGADDYITKPINKELLKARIDTLLQNRNNLQTYFYRKVTLNENNIKISEEEQQFIDKCISIIESRLEDEAFGVDDLAEALHMSRSNLFKKIKAVCNQTPNNFVKYVRLRRAAELFISTAHNVNEVAMLVGFKDVKYFREQFFQLFGLNPSEYIKTYRAPFSKKISLHLGR